MPVKSSKPSDKRFPGYPVSLRLSREMRAEVRALLRDHPMLSEVAILRMAIDSGLPLVRAALAARHAPASTAKEA